MTRRDNSLQRSSPALPAAVNWLLSLLPLGAQGWPQSWPLPLLCVRVFALLAIYVVVDHLMRYVGRLPDSAYSQASLLVGIVERIGYLLSVLALVLVAGVARYGYLLSRWEVLELGKQLRVMIVFLAALIAWVFSTWGYNYYFDQAYFLERVLLLLLVPLIFLRPVFIFPFQLLAFTLMWQIAHLPGIAFVFPHKLQILHVLNLFAAFFLIHAVTGSRRSDVFMLLTLCLLAAAYWEPARAKLALGWFSHGGLYNMPLAAYAHGWLVNLKPETIVAFSNFIAPFDLIMRVFVIVIEASCLFLLWRRWLCMVLLGSVAIFHMGVFIMYGYLFWTWVGLDVAVLVLLYRDRAARQIQIFNFQYLLISVLLIGFAYLWCSPAALAWYDTRLTYTYRLEATGESGAKYTVPSRFLVPYDDVFSMASFRYLVGSHNHLVGPYSVTQNAAIANFLKSAGTAEEIFEAERSLGDHGFRPEAAEEFQVFLKRFFSNWNRRGKQLAWRDSIAAPGQFLTFARGDTFTGQEQVRELVLREVTTLFDERSLREIRTLEILRLAIPLSSAFSRIKNVMHKSGSRYYKLIDIRACSREEFWSTLIAEPKGDAHLDSLEGIRDFLK